MILEAVVLHVIDGEQAEFEAAFGRAHALIACQPGFRGLRLDRSIESPAQYLLQVEWDRLEDHMEGFRQSAEYGPWKALLHKFYDPFPVVEHYERVV